MLWIFVYFWWEIDEHGPVVAVIVLVEFVVSQFDWDWRIVGDEDVVDSLVATYVGGKVGDMALCVGEGVN